MALDTRAKRAAAAHVKRSGTGVTPDATHPLVWRTAVSWMYGSDPFAPPLEGGEKELVVVGFGAESFSGFAPGPGLGWGL